MTWNVEYLPEAVKDLRDLDGSQRQLVAKAIAKVSKNPLPDVEGGYGKPLANKGGNNLSGFLKIKLKASGLRDKKAPGLCCSAVRRQRRNRRFFAHAEGTDML